MIYKYDNRAVVEISGVVGPFTMLFVERSSETGLLSHLSKHVFRSLHYRKYISYDNDHLFQNVSNLI